jgi:hypothetical protein
MKDLNSLIKSRFKPPQKAASERAELIGYFRDRLNATRDGKKYKKLTYAAVAVKLSHIKSLSDLYYLKSVCEDAERRGKPFSAIFWWSIKPQISE